MSEGIKCSEAGSIKSSNCQECAGVTCTPAPSASVGMEPVGRCVHGVVYWNWPSKPIEGDIYHAEQLATLQAKLEEAWSVIAGNNELLEQAEKDKAELAKQLTYWLPPRGTVQSSFREAWDIAHRTLAKYEGKQS